MEVAPGNVSSYLARGGTCRYMRCDERVFFFFLPLLFSFRLYVTGAFDRGSLMSL